MNGFAVEREGTMLLWNEQEVSIDAPCSGIKMLWTGFYLSCALAALWGLNSLRTLQLVAVSLLIVMLANILRATSLFYVEAGVVPQAQPAHALIGILVFIFAALGIAATAVKLRGVAHAS
jgi:exosortase/archaeosortase family protein